MSTCTTPSCSHQNGLVNDICSDCETLNELREGCQADPAFTERARAVLGPDPWQQARADAFAHGLRLAMNELHDGT